MRSQARDGRNASRRAGERARPMLLDRARHRRARLAGADDDRASRRRLRQMRRHAALPARPMRPRHRTSPAAARAAASPAPPTSSRFLLRHQLERTSHAGMIPFGAAIRDAGVEELLRRRRVSAARGRASGRRKGRGSGPSDAARCGSRARKLRLIMRSPWTSRMREEAKPPISACRTLAGSAPAFEAKEQPLATASMVRRR